MKFRRIIVSCGEAAEHLNCFPLLSNDLSDKLTLFRETEHFQIQAADEVARRAFGVKIKTSIFIK